MRATKLYLSAAILPLAASLATPAFAQAAEAAASANANAGAAASASGIAEIVVTAQFRRQNLQDTPIAITAVSGATLQARSQNSITDVAAFAPNVNLTPAPSTFGNSVQAFIRGIGQTDSNAALEPGVGIYIDDVYYGATFGAVFDLSDLDRVEVLRGPQGTLAGKNSVGGAIKLFSQKPDGKGGGYVEATYGSYDRIDLRVGLDAKLTDGLYARLSGVTKHRDGYLKRLDYGCANPGGGLPAQQGGDDCVIGSEGRQNLTAVRGALRYAPDGSPLEVNLVGDLTKDRSQATPSKLISANNPTVRSYDAANPFGGIPLDNRFLTGRESFTSYATYRNGGNYSVFGNIVPGGIPYQVAPGSFVSGPKGSVTAWGFSGTVDYALGDDLSLKSITAYRKASGRAGTDLDATPLNVELIDQRLAHRQFTQELRLSGKVGSFADFTIGGFYYDAHDRIQNRVEIPSFIFDAISNDAVTTVSKSAFGHLELHVTNRLNLIGGIRYTDDKKSYDFSRRNLDGTVPSLPPFGLNFSLVGLDGQSATFKGDRVDYRVGANYHLTDHAMVYAQVSTGFKGGGVNPRPFNPGQVRTFGPEKVTAYEGGVKADLFDRRLRLNGAYFYNDYRDIQVTLLACPDVPCASPANAGNAHVQGVELEATLEPVEGLSINGNFGYLDFNYTRINPATGLSLNDVGPYVSKWQASGGIQYAAPLGEGRLTPRLDWTYQSSFFFNADNSPGSRVAGRNIFNGRLSYETGDRNWQLSASVTNLFDKFYYLTKFDNSAAFGVITGTPARPREWALTVKRRF